MVELLVVISIIAVLIALLMPTLSKVKERMKDVTCQSNLRQWSYGFAAYTEEHRGFFPEGPGELWMDAMTPQFSKKLDFYVCPRATEPNPPFRSGDRFLMWNFSDVHNPGELVEGSYGVNEWLYNPNETGDDLVFGYGKAKHFWRTMNRITLPTSVPLVLDSSWGGAMPKWSDRVRKRERIRGAIWPGINVFFLRRHDDAINSVFLDGSVRKVPLRSLYGFLWHNAWVEQIKEEKKFPGWVP